MVRQIRRKCANFDRENGYCLPLDDLCPQTLTLSLLCRYYRAAVLPDDPALEAEIRKTGQRCQICGAWYSPKGAMQNTARPAPWSSAGRWIGSGKGRRQTIPHFKPGNPSIFNTSRAHNQGGRYLGIPHLYFSRS